jgi:pimeloyl-ACP methyl ester carboxylesterase
VSKGGGDDGREIKRAGAALLPIHHFREWRGRFNPVNRLARAATATLPKVRARTLVIWCDQDRALHPSGATVASDLLTNGKLLMLEHCGHVPQTERSLQTAQAVYDFIEDDGSDEKSSVEQQGQHAAAGDAH